MLHIHEPFWRTCFSDTCVSSSQRLSMILKVKSPWTTSSACVASSHDRKPSSVNGVVCCCFCSSFSFNQKLSTSISTFPSNYHCNVLHGTCLCAGFILYSVPVRLCWAIICVVWTRLEKVMFASHLQILYTCILSITWLKWTNWRIQNHASSK